MVHITDGSQGDLEWMDLEPRPEILRFASQFSILRLVLLLIYYLRK